MHGIRAYELMSTSLRLAAVKIALIGGGGETVER